MNDKYLGDIVDMSRVKINCKLDLLNLNEFNLIQSSTHILMNQNSNQTYDLFNLTQ